MQISEKIKDPYFKKYLAILLLASMSIPLILFGDTLSKIATTGKTPQVPEIITDITETEKEPEPPKETTITISCVGDIMTHNPQIKAQATQNGYDFTNNFQHIAPYISKADLAICNLETTFAGAPYTGYPTFSSPDELATAIKNAGFDTVITANNHMVDKGENGVKRTLEVLKNNGLTPSGSSLTPDQPKYSINNVKGINIGLLAYTYETGNGQKTMINGITVNDSLASLINSYNPNTMEQDLQKIATDMNNLKAAGADIIIVYYHWGVEYQNSPNAHQIQLAQQTADMGADIIFASHPHVLQQMKMITTVDQRQVPVYYSMGNFLSNQRQETLKNPKTENGMIAEVTLTYNLENKNITQIKADAIPTWVDRYYANNKTVYTVIPLTGDYKNLPDMQISKHFTRADNALNDIKNTLNYPISY